MSEIRDKLSQIIENKYPALSTDQTGHLISENLLSPFKIDLFDRHLKQAQEFVHTCYSIRENKKYIQALTSEIESRGLIDPGNKAIVMSYDFHLADDDCLKLIEINTNASFLAMGDLMYQAHNLKQPISDFSIEELKTNIQNELILFGNSNTKPRISIIDENPPEQRLYIEFLVYREIFKNWGFETSIEDIHEVSSNLDFIYNRYTDFYLDEPRSSELKKRYLTKDACFSPNPFEYFLLADKQRMIDLCNPDFLAQIELDENSKKILSRNLPRAMDLTLKNKEEIWTQRKNLFFKPKRSFGAKQSYKGASISRKAFDEISSQGLLAQEYFAAPEKIFATPDGEKSFKYDLRFYAYQGRVQSVVARLYQGQVTNLRTPWGGFAPIVVRP